MVIMGSCEMLEISTELGPAAQREVKEISDAAGWAASLTGQLLAFSRSQVLRPRTFDLNTVVTQMQSLLRRLLGEDVNLQLALRPGLGLVHADPGQVEQVIMNLAINARDAMPRGGILTIETANTTMDEVYLHNHRIGEAGEYVMIAVADTGIGMDEATRARIFEPFFTTKEAGKGTGLGLATVYGIVKQSGGFIWVYSEPGRGSTFKVYLPRRDDAVVSTPIIAAEPASLNGTETILVVEDAPPLRTMIRRALEGRGYTVLEAADGREALTVAGEYADPIHLVLTDVVMPEVSGRQLAEVLGRQRPGLRLLFMSGYTDDSVLRHGLIESDVAYLQKPFSLLVLARKVREVLDAK
jgi:CheY-like chemotaxis protein